MSGLLVHVFKAFEISLGSSAVSWWHLSICGKMQVILCAQSMPPRGTGQAGKAVAMICWQNLGGCANGCVETFSEQCP